MSDAREPVAMRDLMAIRANTRYDKATPGQRALRDEFFAVVAAWRLGQLTIEQVRTLTGDGFLRSKVLSLTPPNHPQYADAMAMLDLLIDTAALHHQRYFTKHGWFSQEDVDGAGGRVIDQIDADGVVTTRIQFPIVTDAGEIVWPSANRPLPFGQLREQYRSPFADEWYGEDTADLHGTPRTSTDEDNTRRHSDLPDSSTTLSTT